MPVLGITRNPMDAFLFDAEVDGIGSSKWKEISTPGYTVNVVKTYEGGAILPERSPGRADTKPITMSRSATLDLDLFGWFTTVVLGAANIGLARPGYERTISVNQRDRDRTVLQQFQLFEAWPADYEPGGFNNESDDKRIEKATIEYHDFILSPP